MIEKILENDDFINMMKEHAKDCLQYLLEENIQFSIMANLDFVNFNPALPQEIIDSFKMPAIVFELGGYTLQSSVLDEEKYMIEFEAGFGESDFASVVSIPVEAIIQIFIENNPIFINFSIPRKNPSKKRKIFSIVD